VAAVRRHLRRDGGGRRGRSGWWLFLIGALAVILSMVGFVFEYYRGHYAH